MEKEAQNSPIPLRLITRIRHADPERARGLAHTEIHEHGHRHDGRVEDVPRVDERLLLAALAVFLPPFHRLLRCRKRTHDIDVQICDHAVQRDTQRRALLRGVRQRGRVVDYHAGVAVEVGVHGGEDRGDAGGLGEVCGEGEDAGGGVEAVCAAAGGEGDGVPGGEG